ncbi:hypothetical protein HZF24_06290 [Sedimentibacter hydroxybenzoicus DSM 7310]|uniref:MacB-like periplasmic core domain-containing protein n=1 Tax=Sedimentibacter hydroxybenzoicus DSM 7310 TaxID=1123245 RepID=A0A974GVU7_SEDHY|nr:hypothetical protein [Sedimentibacter hydroxybenzoicus]NYB73748.1 hypothetical protein [Sedimentibacter hydroxybenzoicus DSM 7310]
MNRIIREYKKEALIFLLLFIAYTMWMYALFINEQVTSCYSGSSYRLESNPIKVNEFNQINEKVNEGKSSAKNITGWFQINNETITDDRDISISSDVIYVFGNVPYELGVTSEYSCAISSDKAYELWNSYNVEGEYVRIGNVKYKVLSVLHGMSDIIIVNANGQSALRDAEITALEVEINEDDFWSPEVFEYENFIESDIIVSYTEITGILSSVSLLPAYGIFLAALAKLVFEIIQNRKNIPYIFILSAIGLIWIIINVKIFQLNFYIPESMIPDKWSNFGFWTSKINSFRGYLRDVALMKSYYPDLHIKSMTDSILIYSVLSAVIFLFSARMLKIRTENKLIVTELVIIIISLLSFLVSYINNIAAKTSNIYWMGIPGYILINYVVNNLNIKYKSFKDVIKCLQ